MPNFYLDKYAPVNHPFIRSVNIAKRKTPLDQGVYFAFDHSYLVLYYEDAMITHPRMGKMKLPNIYVKSPRYYPFCLDMKANDSYIVLVLKPSAFYTLTKQEANKNMDVFTPLQNDSFNKLYEVCRGKTDAKDIYESFKEHCTDIQECNESTPVDIVVDDILNAKGQIKLDDLLKKYPYSLSTLNRYFKKYIGMTVGLYIRLAKFSSLINTISESPDTKLRDIAYAYDFSDQSHFIRDFKKFAGISPREFFGPEYDLIQKSFSQ